MLETQIRTHSESEIVLLEARVPQLEAAVRPSYVMDLLQKLAAHSPWTAAHSIRVGFLVDGMHASLDSPPAIALPGVRAGLLHDVGKTALPGDIVDQPRRLTEGEFALVQQHPQTGADLVFPHDEEVAAIIRGHHAHQGDRSYPASEVQTIRDGERHPLIVEQQLILAVADTVDALFDPTRPYKKPWESSTVLTELETKFGAHFDSDFLHHAVYLGEQQEYNIRV